MRAGQRARWSPYGVLAVSVVLTALATLVLARAVHERELARFRSAVESTHDRIESRLQTHIAILVATASFFESSARVEPDEFKRYVTSLELPRRYPGIQGLGFSARLTPAERGALEEQMRELGHTGFRIWPEYGRAEYHAVMYLEPQDARNRVAMGYDMFTESVRRTAMTRARDTGMPAASRSVTLVQEIERVKPPGFIIYVPVYGGDLPRTAEARRARLRGFVYSPFRTGDLFAGIFGKEQHPILHFEVYDSTSTQRERRIHAEGPPHPASDGHESVSRLSFAGIDWAIRYRSTPAFERASSWPLLILFALLGSVGSGVLFLFSRAQLRARMSAEASEREAIRAREEVEALADELQRAVTARDNFLAVAGHELKTPLATLKLQIQGVEQRARSSGSEPLQRELEPSLARVQRQIQRLERLIYDLLDVSRVASGRLTLERAPFALDELVSEVVERLGEQGARAGCTVMLRASPNIRGEWDRSRLDQVITNLLGNAFKYGSGKPIEVSVQGENGCARIRVCDHGIGIAPEDTERVFGRFERAVSDQHYGGLGLGLWITAEITRAHGGAITVESVPGEGTTFVVELPYTAAAGAPAAGSA